MKKFFQEFCDKVVALDPSIRFAGIADQDGKFEATGERKGLKGLLTQEERAHVDEPSNRRPTQTVRTNDRTTAKTKKTMTTKSP